MPPGGDSGSRQFAAAAEAAWEAVLAVGVTMALGYWIDSKLDTSPWFFFGMLALGLATGFRRLLKLTEQPPPPPAEVPPGSGPDAAPGTGPDAAPGAGDSSQRGPGPGTGSSNPP